MVRNITLIFLFSISWIAGAFAQGPDVGPSVHITSALDNAEGIVPDTTELRWMAFSDGGEVVFFNTDTTNLIYTEAMVGSGSSYHAIFQHPDGRLIVLIDSTQGDGNRNFYEYQPFMSTRQLVFDASASFLAAACVLPNGRVFAMTGNGNSSAGEIYEFDFVNQVDSLFMTIPYSLVNNNPANIVYRASTDELLVFNGGIDTLFVIDYHNRTYQEVAANLAADNTLKATYMDGDMLVSASNVLYLSDLSQGYDLTLSPTAIPDYLSDLDNLDLITGGDTATICSGSSAILGARYQSPFMHWFQDGLPTNQTGSIYFASTPGTYRLLVQMDASATKFMWSETVTVVAAPSPTASIQLSQDTTTTGQTVTFTNTGTQGNAIWDFGDGAGNNGNVTTHAYSAPGTYVVTLLLEDNGCSTIVFDTVVVTLPVSINTGLGMQTLNWGISPNPANRFALITIESAEQANVHLEILDLLGARVRVIREGEIQAGSTKVNLDLNSLSEGIYLVKLSTEQGQQVRKLVVAH